MFKNIHGSISHSSPKLKVTQKFIHSIEYKEKQKKKFLPLTT